MNHSNLDEVTLTEIASHAHVRVDDVRRTYQVILAELHDQAKIHDFIPLLAMKGVRQYFPHNAPFNSKNIETKTLPEEMQQRVNFFETAIHKIS